MVLSIMDLIKTTSYDQSEIIKNILKLHSLENKIDCDLTYSTGNFYNKSGIEHPRYKFDIYPQTKDTVESDSRHIPIEDQKLNCIMFDPPLSPVKRKYQWNQK